jgi:hypothetical protein
MTFITSIPNPNALTRATIKSRYGFSNPGFSNAGAVENMVGGSISHTTLKNTVDIDSRLESNRRFSGSCDSPCLGYGDGDGGKVHAGEARLSLHGHREGHGVLPPLLPALPPPAVLAELLGADDAPPRRAWRPSERQRHHLESSAACLRICAALENPRLFASSCGVVKSSIPVLAAGSAPWESNSWIIRRSFWAAA